MTTEAIKAARKASGYTQQSLADACGMHIRQIQRLETGQIAPGDMAAKNLLAIASALGMTVEELMLGQDNPLDSIQLTSEADSLPPEDRAAIIKAERAKDYSGWRRYPTTCARLIDRIPTAWWSIYSAQHIGEVMRLLEQAYADSRSPH